MLKLYPYQGEGVDGIRGSYKKGRRAPLYVLPTGGGKTVVFSHIAASVAARGKRVMVLVHRIELLRQTSAGLAKSEVDHSLINPKFTPDYTKLVQVASVQTLIKRLHHFEQYPPDLIIIDEAHHALAATWKRIVATFPSARVLGVTATPCRGDGSGLGIESGGVFDDLIIGPQIRELIDMGFLVKPVVYAPLQRLDLSGVRVVRGDFDQKEIEKRVDKPKITGDVVAHYTKLCPGEPCIVFCVSVEHAQHVATEFRAAGYKAYSVDGTMEDEMRKRIINGLGNGSVQVATSCDLISEGTDIPAVACAILLRPTQSTGLFLQQIGRALRTMAGKSRAIVLDHVGNVLRHGMPDEVREWSLKGIDKRKKGSGGGIPVSPVTQCPKCYGMHLPQQFCPYCGHEYKAPAIKVEGGELQEVTEDQAKRIKWKKAEEVTKADSLAALEKIGRDRNYKPGWARHVWENRRANKAKAQQEQLI